MPFIIYILSVSPFLQVLTLVLVFLYSAEEVSGLFFHTVVVEVVVRMRGGGGRGRVQRRPVCASLCGRKEEYGERH